MHQIKVLGFNFSEFESRVGYHLTSYKNFDIIFIERRYGGLTQLGACFSYKEKVGGSSPSSSTIWLGNLCGL